MTDVMVDRRVTLARVVAEWVVPALLGVTLVLLAGLVAAFAVVGSPRDAWLYARRVRLVVVNPTVEFTPGEPGDERPGAFLVKNLSGRPVQILGVNTSRGCVASEELPQTVPPRCLKELRLTMRLEKTESGSIRQTLTYVTDDPATPRFVVEAVARVE